MSWQSQYLSMGLLRFPYSRGASYSQTLYLGWLSLSKSSKDRKGKMLAS